MLRSTALCSVLALLAAPSIAQAFDPDADTDTSSTNRAPAAYHRLPSTAPLMATPSYTPLSLSPIASAAVPVVNTPAPAAPTIEPVVYAPVIATTPAPAAAPQFPPVDPAVVAQAQKEMSAHTSVIAAPPLFTAPAPLIAQPVVPVATPVIVAPVVATPVAAVPLQPLPTAATNAPFTAPATAYATDPGLSTASKKIINHLPSKLDTAKPVVGGKLDVSRMTPALKPIGESETKVQSYDAVGLSIKVARPGIDTNFELNRAYDALMGGDTVTAIETYKKILAAEPSNQDALFGLASTYHRNGEIDKARPYYGQLLRENPNHREGLNNFLALVSDESPEQALVELERLEQKNPDFSPIPAQESIVLSKLGYFEQARDKLIRAIQLAPENLTYKYNLAVMFDRHGDYGDASALYRMLIDASINGAKLPATTETLQKRLNYITTAAASALAASGN